MNNIEQSITRFLASSDADAVAVAIIDFKVLDYKTSVFYKDDKTLHESIYFDLASLSKIFTNSLYALAHPDGLEKKHELLLNHCAGLPSWGLLSNKKWKEQLKGYQIIESETLYSDFSAIRFMLEMPSDYEVFLKSFYPKQIRHWLDLTDEKTLQNGFWNAQVNFRGVHDPNAYNIKSFLPHAGLFGTIEGVAQLLIKMQSNFNLCQLRSSGKRFSKGFDFVTDPNKTLAGIGCTTDTFGHLGFTGTSCWIEPKAMVGYILLTNSTKNYWYQKSAVNLLRRNLGANIWKNSFPLSLL